MKDVILGIDIGSSKICSLISEVKDGVPHVIGMGVQPTKGVRKGAIVNIESASRSIKESVNDAKRIAGTSVNKAIVSISGAYTKSINSRGETNIVKDEIGFAEIRRVIETALYKSNAHIPNNHEVIQVLPYLFKLDGREYIDDPMGMSGNFLEVFVYIVTAQKSGLENLKKAVKNAGIEIENIVLSSYASSIAVLTNDEKELGVACIDMGASSCDVMIHHGNAMRYDYFLGVGSGHITKDISKVFNTTPAAAEKIKIEFGSLFDLTPEEITDVLEIPIMGGDDLSKASLEVRRVSLEIIHGVIVSRVLETLQLIESAIEASSLKNNLGAGVVITGGMAHMKGLRELAYNVFKSLPVSIASPKDINGSFDSLKDPAYATVVGLILYGAGQYTNYEQDSNRQIKLRYTQNKSSQNLNLSDLNVRENDLTDLAMKNEGDEAKNDVVIKVDKGKNKKVDKFMKWLKELF